MHFYTSFHPSVTCVPFTGITNYQGKGCAFYAENNLFTSNCFTGNMGIICRTTGKISA